MAETENPSIDIRQQLQDVIAHLAHVLPGQAPIKDFVHHNTLHGYQHMHFPDALKAAHELTDTYGYETAEHYREYFNNGRITLDDLNAVVNDREDLQANEAIGDKLTRRDIYLTALRYPLNSVTGCQFTWHVEELDELNRFQQDIEQQNRKKLLAAAKIHGEDSEAEAINALWFSCLQSMDLEHYLVHPEELMELDPEAAESLLRHIITEESEAHPGSSLLHRQVEKEAKNLLGQLIRKVGHGLTMRGFLNSLTGQDILEDIRPMLQQHLANYLDQGMSAWHHHQRQQGFYAAWRNSAKHDLIWIFDQLPDWQDSIDCLPEDPLETIIVELGQLGIAETHWAHYLERLALETPGWSGMFLWRQNNPLYGGETQPIEMLDYLAVRLVLERLFAQRLCREQWQIEANLDVLRWYFRRRQSEFFVRYVMFNNRLPEYLVTLAQRQIQRSLLDHDHYQPWRQLADMIMTWRNTPMSDQIKGYSVFDHAWPLFRLAQHLGLCADDVDSLNEEQIAQIFNCIAALDVETSGFIWLQAYERNYRDKLFNALTQNHDHWKARDQRPEAQIVFCMDDREEGIRRHLEEHNPAIETLGAAAHFNVACYWKSIDDEQHASLTPVVLVPSHELRERPADDNETSRLRQHKKRRTLRLKFNSLIHQATRRSLLTPFLISMAAPFSLITLLGKSFSYLSQGLMIERLRNKFDLPVVTRVALNAEDDGSQPTPDNPRLGFTDAEQISRVQTFLNNMGLTRVFGSIIVIMGHGSSSQNNPHLAAYNCGACSGNHSGPNARIFAQICNRPEIRQLLKQGGIDIPDDCWFMGAEHNTCDETIQWYDIDIIPENMQAAFDKLKNDLAIAATGSAHERCRRLASAPYKPSKKKALKHIMGRAYDFTQARPELGHATNAAAYIGRRSATQGAFFDRRLFLISYDPTQDDEEGHIVEGLLLANGPVGAGISLEYYFSTVSNEQYGSGSKITHNVTGLFAVMDGTSSDLRTGLPGQMIEIHEAMRLQVVVEAKTDLLTKIYLRQPPLQELVGKGWILLSAQHPDTGDISIFVPEKGWLPWNGQQHKLATVNTSTDWYDGHHQPLDPVLIKQPIFNQEDSHA